MVHCFEVPFETLNTDRKAGKQQGARKRRREDTNRANDTSTGEPVDPTSSSYEVEKNEEEDVIPTDFPHAPWEETLDFSPFSKIDSKQFSLKQQHLTVLTTILHKCLLASDFDRAARTFGILLRVENGGKHVDLRKRRLWGLAAETLLHRDERTTLNGESEDSEFQTSGTDASGRASDSLSGFTQNGLKAGRAFYDRLILQYPYKKSRPHDINASTFYPAMFGLWISQIQNSVQILLEDMQDSHPVETTTPSERSNSHLVDGSRSGSPEYENGSFSADSGDGKSEKRRQYKEIKANELHQAHEVAQRLDELTLLPPYDQDVRLLRLRGMIAMWIADLCHLLGGDTNAEEEQREKAQTAFRQVKQYGGHLWEGVVHLTEE